MLLIFTSLLLALEVNGQDSVNNSTILREAGDYSANHDVLAVVALRGTAYKNEYDRYFEILSQKLDSMEIPHKIFQEFNKKKKGTVVGYFIENDMNGPMAADELAALLPHIQRRFRSQYPEKHY